MSKKKQVYRVQFYNQDRMYEIYAKSIAESNVYGFVEVSELLFNQDNHMLVDPNEEKLKSEFSGVNCTLIPAHAILRIDIVEKEGTPKISPVPKDNIRELSNYNIHKTHTD